jgi:hypothetical protein
MAIALIATCLALTSCPAGGPDPNPESTFLALDALSPEMEDLIDSLDTKIHDHLYGYVLSYNRVISLTNSVLLADLKKTSREILAQRSAAALAEIEDLIKKCRTMETFAETELKPTLDDFSAKNPRQVAALSAKKAKGDEWRARRLIEMMLDYEYQAKFDLQKISRATGVGMAKLKFLMDQTNRQLQTNVDIVDYQEYDKEIARIETIRDTANTVNSALSLINPVQAMIKGGATATAAAAAGWVSKTKTAVAVVENSSALLSFTSGVVNLAVAQEDIPPAFKAVSRANDYLGIVLSGKQGFSGANWGEKTVGIIGTGTGTTTMYFEVKNGGVEASPAKILPGTPADINPSTEASLGDLLPEGFYSIPDVDLDSWDFPDFDWGGADKEDFWIDLYEDTATPAAIEEMRVIFDAFTADWDPKPNSERTKKARAASEKGMPDFFEEDADDFPDPGDLGDAPIQEDFSVGLSASTLTGLLPLVVDFTASPNQAFLPGEITFVWDFDDGTALQTFEPGDPGYGNAIRHTFTSGTDYFDVKVRAEDGRGFWAEKVLRITITDTLQDIIDEHGENSTIHIPAGTYSGDIKLWKGCSLIGAGAGSTILEGSIELYPDTRIEGFTFRKSEGNAITATVEAFALSGLTEFYAEIEDNVIEEAGGFGVLIEPNYTLPFTGFINNNTMTDCSTGGVYIYYLGENGNIIGNTITGINVTSNSPGIILHHDTMDTLIQNNTITHYNTGINTNTHKGNILNNTISENGIGVIIGSTDTSALIAENLIEKGKNSGIYISDNHYGSIQNNQIKDNQSSIGCGGIDINNVYSGSAITGNTVTGNLSSASNTGGGLNISIFHGGTISSNTISGNATRYDGYSAQGGGVKIATVSSGASFINNIVADNASLHSLGGGVFINKLEGTFSGNQVTGNSAKTNGGGVYIQGPATAASPKIKDSNTISGNSLSAPVLNAKADLFTPWEGDIIPAD